MLFAGSARAARRATNGACYSALMLAAAAICGLLCCVRPVSANAPIGYYACAVSCPNGKRFTPRDNTCRDVDNCALRKLPRSRSHSKPSLLSSHAPVSVLSLQPQP